MAMMKRKPWTPLKYQMMSVISDYARMVLANGLQAEDDEFKLDGFDTLGVIEEDDDEEGANDYDPEYDDAIAEQKRKRVKPTATNLQRGAMYTQTAKAEAFIRQANVSCPWHFWSPQPQEGRDSAGVPQTCFS
jgi:hypothetical protein